MLSAAFFIVLSGMVLTTISITQGKARRHACPAELYYAIGSSVAFVIALTARLCTGEFLPSQWSWLVFIYTVLAAATNSIANLSTMINVGYGHAALYLALSTLGFTISFSWSVLVWGEPISPLNSFGMFCLVAAVVLSALAKDNPKDIQGYHEDARTVRKRLLLALCSTVTCGISQILFVFPFSAGFNATPLPSMVKIPIIMLTYLLIYWGIFLFKRRRYTSLPAMKTVLTYPVCWGMLGVISYLILFAAMKYMGQIGRAGLTYPLGNVLQILFFALFCRFVYHEKLTLRQCIALGLIFIGIFSVQS